MTLREETVLRALVRAAIDMRDERWRRVGDGLRVRDVPRRGPSAREAGRLDVSEYVREII